MEAESSKYKVQLPFFEGPLDLLLTLVEQSELDITEISLAEVTGQYREYLELLGQLDVEIESSYLLVFAQLLELKSRLLLPTVEPDDDGMMLGQDEEDPEDDLVARLREYQKLKRAAMWLAERESQSLARYPHPSGLSEPETPLLNVSRRSLHLAALRVLRPRKPFKEPIGYRRVELSVPERVEEIWSHLTRENRRLSFSELLRRDGDRKSLVVVTFLALLEMARRERVRLYQSDYRSELEAEMLETPQASPDTLTHAPISLN
jgi:segregation and condensation protein A